MRVIAYIASALLLFSCNVGPDLDEVQEDFLREYPEAQIQLLGPGEGDFDNVYIHIRYLPGAEKTPHEDIWLYQRIEGRWINTGRQHHGEDWVLLPAAP